jgi:hypothetical protein
VAIGIRQYSVEELDGNFGLKWLMEHRRGIEYALRCHPAGFEDALKKNLAVFDVVIDREVERLEAAGEQVDELVRSLNGLGDLLQPQRKNGQRPSETS